MHSSTKKTHLSAATCETEAKSFEQIAKEVGEGSNIVNTNSWEGLTTSIKTLNLQFKEDRNFETFSLLVNKIKTAIIYIKFKKSLRGASEKLTLERLSQLQSFINELIACIEKLATNKNQPKWEIILNYFQNNKSNPYSSEFMYQWANGVELFLQAPLPLDIPVSPSSTAISLDAFNYSPRAKVNTDVKFIAQLVTVGVDRSQLNVDPEMYNRTKIIAQNGFLKADPWYKRIFCCCKNDTTQSMEEALLENENKKSLSI